MRYHHHSPAPIAQRGFGATADGHQCRWNNPLRLKLMQGKSTFGRLKPSANLGWTFDQTFCWNLPFTDGRLSHRQPLEPQHPFSSQAPRRVFIQEKKNSSAVPRWSYLGFYSSFRISLVLFDKGSLANAGWHSCVPRTAKIQKTVTRPRCYLADLHNQI